MTNSWYDGATTHQNRTYRHLTREKRAQIEVLLQLKLPKSRIAREVGIARSTLYNELARGTVQQLGRNLEPYTRYFGDSGQRVYEHRRRNSHCPMKLVKAKKFVSFAVKQILTKHLAPDTICGLAREKGCFTEMVCSKTLYNYIERGLLKARNIDLTLKVKRKQHRKGHPQHKRLYGLSIEARPQVVNQREEFGHWEIDTVVGRRESQSVLLTQAVEQGLKTLRELYGERFSQVFRSITSDNGSEFASLPQLLSTIPIYYAHPYSAYERGLNEKQNSLIRRFLPKGRSFDVVTDEQIREIQDWINQLPRKSFHYSLPEELFQTVLLDLAI